MIVTNKDNLPEILVDFVRNDTYDFIEDENNISVTSLIDSPLIRKLRMEYKDELILIILNIINIISDGKNVFILFPFIEIEDKVAFWLIQKTCKELGIGYTYKAIEEYLGVR